MVQWSIGPSGPLQGISGLWSCIFIMVSAKKHASANCNRRIFIYCTTYCNRKLPHGQPLKQHQQDLGSSFYVKIYRQLDRIPPQRPDTLCSAILKFDFGLGFGVCFKFGPNNGHKFTKSLNGFDLFRLFSPYFHRVLFC